METLPSGACASSRATSPPSAARSRSSPSGSTSPSGYWLRDGKRERFRKAGERPGKGEGWGGPFPPPPSARLSPHPPTPPAPQTPFSGGRMKVGAPKEPPISERRLALGPATAGRLAKARAEGPVEPAAGA